MIENEIGKRGFVLHNTRLHRYGYKAWEIQYQLHHVKKNSFTPWNANFDAYGSLVETLRASQEGPAAPFTDEEATQLAILHINAVNRIVHTLEGESIVVYGYRLRQGLKNEWIIEKFRPKSVKWSAIKYPTRWATGIEGMFDICIAKGVDYIVYHAPGLADRIERSVRELQHGILLD